MSDDNIFDKEFAVSEKAFIKWKCIRCSFENRENAKDMFVVTNIATTSCSDCGKISILDLKSLKHAEFK